MNLNCEFLAIHERQNLKLRCFTNSLINYSKYLFYWMENLLLLNFKLYCMSN